MYNVYVYDKVKAHEESVRQAQTRQAHQARSAKWTRDELANNHYRRMTRQIARMAIDPTPLPPKTLSLPRPCLGEAFMRYQPKDAAERVNDSLTQNRFLDTVPNPKPLFKLRERVRTKELHADMHFTPCDRHQRLTDAWEYQRSILESSWQPRHRSSQSCAQRSYYKTLETIAYDLNGAAGRVLQKSQLSELPGSPDDLVQEQDLLTVANEAVAKCNMRSSKLAES